VPAAHQGAGVPVTVPAVTARPEPELLGRWLARHVGARPRDVLFEHVHLSVVLGLRLDDGREVVVKVRRPAARLAACWRVHMAVHRAGFCAPRPLVGPRPLGDGCATVEDMVPPGEALGGDGDAARRSAAALGALLRVTPPPDRAGALGPHPPWTDWRRRGRSGRLWPPPDDRRIDLNAVPGPDWLDDAAARASARLAALRRPPVVGHGDWHSGNVRWRAGRPSAVFDWDSAVCDAAPVIAGFAAAVFSATADGPPWGLPSVDRSAAFLDAFAAQAPRPWTADDVEAAWAAGLWVRCFNAKKLVGDGAAPSVDRQEVTDRLALACA
jgi:hypothetical protein